jgi:hypothetical protein
MWSRDAVRYAGYFEISRGVSRIAVGWMSNPDKPEIISLVGGSGETLRLGKCGEIN